MKHVLLALALTSPLQVHALSAGILSGQAGSKAPALPLDAAPAKSFKSAEPVEARKPTALLELLDAVGSKGAPVVMASGNPNDAPHGCHNVCIARDITGLCLEWMPVCN